MKLFITGGAGFIGSNYVRWVLSHSDDEVTVYDALTYAGNLATLADVEKSAGDRYRFVHADICDLASPGGSSGRPRRRRPLRRREPRRPVDLGPEDFAMTNCVGTNMVMQAARRLGIERVVHISTDEVYGSVPHGSSLETDRLEPRSPYSASKAGSDLIALSYYTTYGLPVMVTRSSNNFGPWQYPEKIVPLFVTNLLDGKNVPLYGDGLNQRDWLFVEDNCAAVDLVLRTGAAGRDLQHRCRQRAAQPGSHRTSSWPWPAPGPRGSITSPTAWATTGATASVRRKCGRWAGAPSTTSTRR